MGDDYVYQTSDVYFPASSQPINVTDVMLADDVTSVARETGGIPDMTYLYLTVSVFYALVFLFGVTGNVLVIAVICRIPEMFTATNCFLVNLSVADLLVLLVCMPPAFVEFIDKDKWQMGAFMCKYLNSCRIVFFILFVCSLIRSFKLHVFS